MNVLPQYLMPFYEAGFAHGVRLLATIVANEKVKVPEGEALLAIRVTDLDDANNIWSFLTQCEDGTEVLGLKITTVPTQIFATLPESKMPLHQHLEAWQENKVDTQQPTILSEMCGLMCARAIAGAMKSHWLDAKKITMLEPEDFNFILTLPNVPHALLFELSAQAYSPLTALHRL